MLKRRSFSTYLINGSAFGGIIQGGANSHLVFGINDNDSNEDDSNDNINDNEEYIINFQGNRTTVDVHKYTDKDNF